MKRTLKFLGTGLLSLLLLASCGHFSNPELKGIEKVKMGKLSIGGASIRLDLRYFNPNHSGLKLKSAEGDVWLDSNFVGHFVVDTSVRIPANADFILPVTLKPDIQFFLANDLKALASKDVWVKVTGKARIGKSFYSTTKDIHYEGTQNLSLLLKDKLLQFGLSD